ncbi:hypothetical protein Vretifemale_17165 [Volvox reticuliferus]|uniref:TAZ-type domain-containing protein n=1 Tax=Volvox reticuliferus TaxID=1737510 RepID=A0A8J4FWA8_9CHLO|nr:hypothetical protein Vretifemale_17165 [Volvox reticuliferus]
MTPLNGDDPAFLETCHRWLLFHYHCKGCSYNEGACEYGKVCSYGKSTFTHVRVCHRSDCSFPRCELIKSILRHHQDCKDDDCRMCSPVCKYQARSKSVLAHSQAQAMVDISRTIPEGLCSGLEGSEQLLSLPSRQQGPRRGKRDSMTVLEVQAAPAQHMALHQKQQQQQEQQNAGMLFEARHREHKRQFSSSLSRTSWSMDATGTAPTNSSAASSSGCTLTHVPSESLDAAAELQALQLEKRPPQQQRQPSPEGQEQRPQQQEQQQQSTAESTQQAHPVKGLTSPPVPPVGPKACSSPFGSSSVPSPGGVAGQQAPQAVGSWPVTQAPTGMPQQPRQQLPLQPPPYHHDQQSSSMYGSNAPEMIMYPNLLQQQPMSFIPVLEPHNGSYLMLSQQQQLQHITALQGPQQRQTPLSFVQEVALGPAVQCVTPAGPFQGAPHLPAHQHHQQQQPLGVVTTAVVAGAGAPSDTGAHFFQTHVPLPFISLPYNSFVQTLEQQQQPSQMGNLAPDMSYTPVHHHMYGPPGHPSSMLLTPAHQQQYQHPQMPPQQLQQPPPGIMARSGAHVQASPGFLMAASTAGSLVGCGPVAIDSNGVASGLSASWAPFHQSGAGAQRQQVPPPGPQQYHPPQGQSPAAAAFSTTMPSAFLATQLAGAM